MKDFFSLVRDVIKEYYILVKVKIIIDKFPIASFKNKYQILINNILINYI